MRKKAHTYYSNSIFTNALIDFRYNYFYSENNIGNLFSRLVQAFGTTNHELLIHIFILCTAQDLFKTYLRYRNQLAFINGMASNFH